MLAIEFVPEKQGVIEQDLDEITFYPMWQDRFSDTDNIEQQQKEVNNLIKLFRNHRTFV